MKIYISGQISNLPFEDAKIQFELVEKTLFELGHEVVNPMTVHHDHDKTWQSYMKVDIKHLVDCDAIFLLDNWKHSRGAKIELNLAIDLGLHVIQERNWQKMTKFARSLEPALCENNCFM